MYWVETSQKYNGKNYKRAYHSSSKVLLGAVEKSKICTISHENLWPGIEVVKLGKPRAMLVLC